MSAVPPRRGGGRGLGREDGQRAKKRQHLGGGARRLPSLSRRLGRRRKRKSKRVVWHRVRVPSCAAVAFSLGAWPAGHSAQPMAAHSIAAYRTRPVVHPIPASQPRGYDQPSVQQLVFQAVRKDHVLAPDQRVVPAIVHTAVSAPAQQPRAKRRTLASQASAQCRRRTCRRAARNRSSDSWRGRGQARGPRGP